MKGWGKQAAIILLMMFALTMLGLYGAYLTMESTTGCTEHDFISLRIVEGLVQTTFLGINKEFDISVLLPIKDYVQEMLNKRRWQD